MAADDTIEKALASVEEALTNVREALGGDVQEAPVGKKLIGDGKELIGDVMEAIGDGKVITNLKEALGGEVEAKQPESNGHGSLDGHANGHGDHANGHDGDQAVSNGHNDNESESKNEEINVEEVVMKEEPVKRGSAFLTEVLDAEDIQEAVSVVSAMAGITIPSLDMKETAVAKGETTAETAGEVTVNVEEKESETPALVSASDNVSCETCEGEVVEDVETGGDDKGEVEIKDGHEEVSEPIDPSGESTCYHLSLVSHYVSLDTCPKDFCDNEIPVTETGGEIAQETVKEIDANDEVTEEITETVGEIVVDDKESEAPDAPLESAGEFPTSFDSHFVSSGIESTACETSMVAHCVPLGIENMECETSMVVHCVSSGPEPAENQTSMVSHFVTSGSESMGCETSMVSHYVSSGTEPVESQTSMVSHYVPIGLENLGCQTSMVSHCVSSSGTDSMGCQTSMVAHCLPLVTSPEAPCDEQMVSEIKVETNADSNESKISEGPHLSLVSHYVTSCAEYAGCPISMVSHCLPLVTPPKAEEGNIEDGKEVSEETKTEVLDEAVVENKSPLVESEQVVEEHAELISEEANAENVEEDSEVSQQDKEVTQEVQEEAVGTKCDVGQENPEEEAEKVVAQDLQKEIDEVVDEKIQQVNEAINETLTAIEEDVATHVQDDHSVEIYKPFEVSKNLIENLVDRKSGDEIAIDHIEEKYEAESKIETVLNQPEEEVTEHISSEEVVEQAENEFVNDGGVTAQKVPVEPADAVEVLVSEPEVKLHEAVKEPLEEVTSNGLETSETQEPESNADSPEKVSVDEPPELKVCASLDKDLTDTHIKDVLPETSLAKHDEAVAEIVNEKAETILEKNAEVVEEQPIGEVEVSAATFDAIQSCIKTPEGSGAVTEPTADEPEKVAPPNETEAAPEGSGAANKAPEDEPIKVDTKTAQQTRPPRSKKAPVGQIDVPKAPSVPEAKSTQPEEPTKAPPRETAVAEVITCEEAAISANTMDIAVQALGSQEAPVVEELLRKDDEPVDQVEANEKSRRSQEVMEKSAHCEDKSVEIVADNPKEVAVDPHPIPESLSSPMIVVHQPSFDLPEVSEPPKELLMLDETHAVLPSILPTPSNAPFDPLIFAIAVLVLFLAFLVYGY